MVYRKGHFGVEHGKDLPKKEVKKLVERVRKRILW